MKRINYDTHVRDVSSFVIVFTFIFLCVIFVPIFWVIEAYANLKKFVSGR